MPYPQTSDLLTADLIVEDSGDVQRVRLEGRLDSASVVAVEKRVDAATVTCQKHVIVDLGGVSFMTSPAVRMLVAAAKRMAIAGYILVLLEPQRLVNEYLEAADIYRLVPVAYSENEAALLLAD